MQADWQSVLTLSPVGSDPELWYDPIFNSWGPSRNLYKTVDQHLRFRTYCSRPYMESCDKFQFALTVESCECRPRTEAALSKFLHADLANIVGSYLEPDLSELSHLGEYLTI